MDVVDVVDKAWRDLTKLSQLLRKRLSFVQDFPHHFGYLFHRERF